MIILDSYHVHVVSTEKKVYERQSTGANDWLVRWSERTGLATNYSVKALELEESRALEERFRKEFSGKEQK